jgi:chemotaxis response regulator CheB
MADTEVRVALLARPGNARDQLHRALTELGALLVAEGDPAELDPKTVSEQSPNLVLVSLEPAIEASLSRFDGLLAKPGVEVMYDDAEVTQKLDGWDLNRWARHLATKLLGRELLPPAPGGSDHVPNMDLTPRPGAVPTPAEQMADARLEDYTRDTHGLADSVPTNPSLTDIAVEQPQMSPEPVAEPEASDLDFDFKDIEAAMEPRADEAAPADGFMPSGTIAEPETSELVLDQDFEIDFDLAELDAAANRAATEPMKTEPAEDNAEPLLADIDFESSEPVKFSSYQEDENVSAGEDLDADVAAMAAQLEAFEKADQRRPAQDQDFSVNFDAAPDTNAGKRKPEAPPAASKPVTAKQAKQDKKADYDLSGLSLTSMDEPVPASTQTPAAARSEQAARDTSHLSLESLDEPVAPMFSGKKIESAAEPSKSVGTLRLDELDAEPSASTAGLVLIIAGMGGPDAVRQMLSSLPESMPVPVLLYQHLEVGKHERLVEQLAKISHIPVHLAQDGATPKAGELSVLPAGMSGRSDGASIRFSSGSLSELIAALPARDSVIVMLSGADATLVPAARAVDQAGGLTLAQDPDSCFDSAAAVALKRLGSQTYPALGLARQVAARWSL